MPRLHRCLNPTKTTPDLPKQPAVKCAFTRESPEWAKGPAQRAPRNSVNWGAINTELLEPGHEAGMALVNPLLQWDRALLDPLNHTRHPERLPAPQPGCDLISAELWQLIYLQRALSSELGEQGGLPQLLPLPSARDRNLLFQRWHFKLPKIPA